MTSMLIDTQKVVERLIAAGVPLDQARAHAAVLADVAASVQSHTSENYASKDSVAIAIKSFEASIEKLRGDLTRWVVTVGILETAFLSIVVTLTR